MDKGISKDDEPSSEEDTLNLGFIERNKGKKVNSGLLDLDYISEELEIGEDMSGDYSYEGIKVKYRSFVIPKNFIDYK